MLKDKRVLYSVGASIMVVVFLIWSIAPMMSTDAVPTNIFEAQDIQGYDLSQMPFSTDLVEGELLNQEEYKDIKKKGSTGVLYSKEDKERRKVADKFAITDSRTGKKVSTDDTTSARKYTGGSGVKQTTQVQQMSSSGGFRVGGGGGGSSTSGKTWSGTDSQKSYGYGGSGVGASGVGLNDADKRALARQIALQRAGKLSEQAAGQENEAAAESAAEAFAGGEKAAELDTELEAAADELGLDGDLSGLGEGNLADVIDSTVDQAESDFERIPPEMQENFWDNFWMMVAERGIDMLGNVATSWLSGKYGDPDDPDDPDPDTNTGSGSVSLDPCDDPWC